MADPTVEQREAARNAITAALSTIPPGEQTMWPAEWVVCAAWVDDEGDTWMMRFASGDKVPEYRIEGLLHFSELATWEAAGTRDDD